MTKSILAGLVAVVVLDTMSMARADGVTLTAVIHGQVHEHPVQVQMLATRIDGSACLDRMISVPGTQALELPAGNWELAIRSNEFWAAPTVVSTGQAGSLILWPAGLLRATAKAAQRGMTVIDLRVGFSPAPELPTDSYPIGHTTCALADGQWRCVVPAGTCDLRVLSTGYAAEFRWRQEISQGKALDLGDLRLRPGASLIGAVTTARGVKAEMADVVVIAKVRTAATTATTRGYTAPVNARGVFQIAGLPPGDYVVHAESKRLRSEDRPAAIIEDRSAELRSALVLDWPRRIFLTVRSSLAIEHPRWHLRLYRQYPAAGRVEEYWTAVTDKDGNWSTEVVPGQYFLEVGQTDGSIWSSTTLEVADADLHRDIFIAAAKVAGRLRLGDEPVAQAQLTFGEQGAEQVLIVTDREGQFAGEIPVKDDAEQAKWRISIQSDEPSVKRTADYVATKGEDGTLRFNIDLPKTIVRGRVVNEDRTPQPGAIVSLKSLDGQVFEQANAAGDGYFELYGFEPGEYRVQADAFQRSSDIISIQATENETSEIEIVLRKTVRITGRVQSRSRTGVFAKLVALQREVSAAFVPSTTTDSEGLFELILPPQTRIFDLIVDAPGFALSTGRVVMQDDKALTLTMDQAGGVLSLVIPKGAQANIRHDGAEFPARWLANRSGGIVQEREKEDAISLPSVEAGEYVVCVDATCRQGVVTPRGSLELSIP